MTSSVPGEALAMGRVVLEVADKSGITSPPTLAKQIAERTITSATGQLQWRYPSHDESYVTVDTAGTKGLVGFAPNKPFALGDVKLQVDGRFAVLLVTALDRGKDLGGTRSALITALARARNTGMTYKPNRSLAAVGKAPILLEPVSGSVTFTRKISKVILLDHDGRRTERLAKVAGGVVTIDGAEDKTMYYEVVFE
jgi:hypothetical protein